ncbi:MAG: Dihydrolipoyllysine-residue acetyltransferase component of pyruvate dehydrogenase complex [Gammaproteobacteria bacterium]|nr:Dihydrolipoyllysine-residue acetyltransferase component of pyruvate dehydrogenase complex [Gammaproteobacteria bacterium]
MTAKEIKVPDIGDFEDVPVIEVLVNEGDTVAVETPLITLESDKAAMDVPSPEAGTVQRIIVGVDDKVSRGSPILTLEVEDSGEQTEDGDLSRTEDDSTPETAPKSDADAVESGTGQARADTESERETKAGTSDTGEPRSRPTPPLDEIPRKGPMPHASPSVRRFSRELGIDINQVEGSGRKGRILKDDVQSWVKNRIHEAAPAPASGEGPALPEIPDIDFSQFGEVEVVPLGRIKKLTAVNLHRSWLHVPHVTQHEEADITELEEFRRKLKEEAAERGVRVTLLAFLMKACVAALREYPRFNASLEKGGENLVVKKYYNIGIAVDTPGGLVVPAIRNVDRKGIYELAEELGDVSQRTRDKKLSPNDLQGAGFTISSLGGIGGTAFTPIVNAPEVAILGVSRAQMKPVYQDGEFVPRLMLPLALSYDHRVVDGADGARFVVFLSKALEDARRLLL